MRLSCVQDSRQSHTHDTMTNSSTPHDSLTLLSPDDQKQWLVEHIPHRVRVILPGIRMTGAWAVNPEADDSTDPIAFRCRGDAIWEGRLTSMRWLIMLVGISATGAKGEPARPCIRDRDKDVFITRIDGGQMRLFPSGDDAKTLALVWAGCSKATAHPTNCAHPEVDEPELAAALTLVVAHLQSTIYAKAGKSLINFVLTTKSPKQLLAEW